MVTGFVLTAVLVAALAGYGAGKISETRQAAYRAGCALVLALLIAGFAWF